MESRIKQLRENRGLIQEILASELGITQQMLSKYERDVLCIKVDVLKRIAEYFNVTTDYLLGVSEVKRDLQGQMKVNKTLDTYYDLIEIYKGLDEYDQEMVWSIMQTVKKSCVKNVKETRKIQKRVDEKMLNIAICDDDIQTTGRMDMLLQEIAKRNFMDVEIEVFWNGKSLADAVAKGTYFDMIYLDIEMDKEDGISAAKRIRAYDKNVLIIYVTSHENHMQESFEVRPFRFLVKPVSEKQIESCFKSAYEEVYCGDSYFRYSYQRVNHKIPIREILYFESNKRKVFIVTEKDTFVAYGKLNDIEESLKQSKVPFLRVHQSYLVNYKHVEGQAYDFVVMDNGKRISISEDRRKLIGEQYCSMEDTFYVNE